MRKKTRASKTIRLLTKLSQTTKLSRVKTPSRIAARFVAAFIGSLFMTFAPGEAAARFAFVESEPDRFEWRGQLRTQFLNEFETDTNAGDEFDAWHLGIGGEFAGPINESILVGGSAAYRHSEYDFHLDNGPSASFGGSELPKDPWGGLDVIDLAPEATVLVGERVRVTAAVPIRRSAEVGARKNAFVAGISARATWQVTDTFKAGLGIGVTSQLEGDAETFPVVSLDWQITESLRLATQGGWIQGGHAGLFWGPNHSVAFSLVAGYERNRFRLDDNGTSADTDGIGEITQVPIEVGLRIRIAEDAFLDIRGGFAFVGHLRVETRKGQRLYEQGFDPAPRIGVQLTIPLGDRASEPPPVSTQGFDPAWPDRGARR